MNWRAWKTSSVGGILVASLILANVFPFVLSFPPVGQKWEFFYWENKIFVAVTCFGILISLFCSWKHKDWLSRRITALAILYTLIHSIGLIVYVAVKVYLLWESSPLGRNLLPPVSDYFYLIILRFAKPYIIGLSLGSMLVIFQWIYTKITISRQITSLDMLVTLWMGMVLGWERFLGAILLTLVIAAIFLLLTKDTHAKITPFLLLAFFIMIFWGQLFSQYMLGLN